MGYVAQRLLNELPSKVGNGKYRLYVEENLIIFLFSKPEVE